MSCSLSCITAALPMRPACTSTCRCRKQQNIGEQLLRDCGPMWRAHKRWGGPRKACQAHASKQDRNRNDVVDFHVMLKELHQGCTANATSLYRCTQQQYTRDRQRYPASHPPAGVILTSLLCETTCKTETTGHLKCLMKQPSRRCCILHSPCPSVQTYLHSRCPSPSRAHMAYTRLRAPSLGMFAQSFDRQPLMLLPLPAASTLRLAAHEPAIASLSLSVTVPLSLRFSSSLPPFPSCALSLLTHKGMYTG